MSGLFYNFFSHRTLFYDSFNQASKNLVKMAQLLVSIVNTESATEREPLFKQINTLEKSGDNITHKVFLGLDKVTFTPFNRKDIYILASALDDVADNIHEATGRMHLYDITEFIPTMKEMAEYILKSSTEIEHLVISLSRIKDIELMFESCKQIKQYEHQTDLIYYKSLADLFENEKDAITLIKYRDILSSLEASANKCKNVTDAIETILINSI